MKVSAEKLENRQVALDIEATSEEIEESVKKAYQRLAQKVSVPGFRKGKTPLAILERYLGKERLQSEAIELLLPQLYQQALREQQLEAIAPPEIEIVQREPLKFRVKASLPPVVELGDYYGVRITPETIEVRSEDVEAVIEHLRQQLASWEPVDRPARLEDMLIADAERKLGDSPLPRVENGVYYVSSDLRIPLPGFSEQLIGLEKGQEKEFTLSYPVDYEDKVLAGKEFYFKIKVKEIKEKHLPELNDEFATSVGRGVDTLDTLRERIMADLKVGAEETARRKLEQGVLETIAEQSQVEFPPVLVEEEADYLLKVQSSGFGEGEKGLRNYLQYVRKSEEQVRKEMYPLARKHLTHALILDKVAELEQLTVSEEEIEAALKDRKGKGDQEVKLPSELAEQERRNSASQWLLRRKSLQRLVEIATSAISPETKQEEKEEKSEASS